MFYRPCLVCPKGLALIAEQVTRKPFARQDDRNATIVLLNNTSDFPRFEMTDLILIELHR